MTAQNSSQNIAVFMGGKSHEAAISLRSGCAICAHLSPSRYHFRAVYLSPDGTAALLPIDTVPTPEMCVAQPTDALLSVMQELRAWPVSIAIPALHGRGGEDGVFQGFLETLGIPYTHSGVLGAAVSLDKVMARAVYHAHGIPHPRGIVVTPATDIAEAVSSANLSFPLVVKPPSLGSSYAVNIVKDMATYQAALDMAFAEESRALVEEYVVGREYTCAVIQRTPQSAPEALPVTEIIPSNHAFFATEAKYTPGITQEITPAALSLRITQQVQHYAVRCHQILRCGSVSRTDFILRADDTPCVLETNSIPGMTAQSLLPQAAAAADISFSDLLNIMIEYACMREWHHA